MTHRLLRAFPRAATPGPFRGQLLMLASTFCFAAMHATIRHVSAELHTFEIAFFRNLFGLLVLVPALTRQGLSILRTERLPLHALRALLSMITMLGLIAGLSLTPLAEATSLNFTVPIFATLLAVFVLGEPLGATLAVALAIGFSGALVVLRPGFHEIGFGPVAILVSACSWGCGIVVTKIIARTDSAITVVAYMTVLALPITLVLALFVWRWPTPAQLYWLVQLGILGGLAHVCLSQAVKEAEATAVAPIDFARLIWASLLGYVVFGEVPSLWVWTGAGMIFAAVLLITYREARAGAGNRPHAGEKP